MKIPTSPSDIFHLSAETMPEIGPGIHGLKGLRRGGVLYFAFFFSVRQGQGNVSRFLDTLPRDRATQFWDVFSPILVGMLERRGFLPETVEVMRPWCRYAGGKHISAYVRHAEVPVNSDEGV